MAGKDEKAQVKRREVLEKIASAVFASLVAPAVLSETAEAATERQQTETPKLPELPPLAPMKTRSSG